jgi:K+ transporter
MPDGADRADELGGGSEQYSQVLRVARIISLAMLGSVTISGVVLVVLTGGRMQEDIGLLGVVGLAAGGGSLVLSSVLTGVLRKQRSADAAAGTQAFLTTVIIPLAVLEGAAVLNCVAGFVEGSWFSLVALAAIWAVMLTRVPRQSTLRSWLEQERRLDEQQQWQ